MLAGHGRCPEEPPACGHGIEPDDWKFKTDDSHLTAGECPRAKEIEKAQYSTKGERDEEDGTQLRRSTYKARISAHV